MLAVSDELTSIVYHLTITFLEALSSLGSLHTGCEMNSHSRTFLEHLLFLLFVCRHDLARHHMVIAILRSYSCASRAFDRRYCFARDFVRGRHPFTWLGGSLVEPLCCLLVWCWQQCSLMYRLSITNGRCRRDMLLQWALWLLVYLSSNVLYCASFFRLNVCVASTSDHFIHLLLFISNHYLSVTWVSIPTILFRLSYNNCIVSLAMLAESLSFAFIDPCVVRTHQGSLNPLSSVHTK